MSLRSGPRLERGVGLFSMSFGLLVSFLALLFTVQFLYDLYATSVITAHAHDAARSVAGYDNVDARAAATGAAEADLRSALGTYDGTLVVDWTITESSVSLTIAADHPSVMPAMFGPLALDRVEETIIVRAEEPR